MMCTSRSLPASLPAVPVPVLQPTQATASQPACRAHATSTAYRVCISALPTECVSAPCLLPAPASATACRCPCYCYCLQGVEISSPCLILPGDEEQPLNDAGMQALAEVVKVGWGGGGGAQCCRVGSGSYARGEGLGFKGTRVRV